MALLVNKESGLAEDLPQEAADSALQSGTHEIPLNDPQGNPVTAPHDQAQQLLSQGYSQPNPEQLQKMLDYAKYTSTGEEIKAGLEGAASAATFGGSAAVERALGVEPEDIRARAETNPNIHAYGELAGLVASHFVPGLGEAADVEKAAGAINPLSASSIISGVGKAGSEALGLGKEGSGIISHIGSRAAQFGIENALFSAGDENSKFLSGDPNQTAETAALNIGLSGLVGAAGGAVFGAMSPLWASKNASSVESAIEAFNGRVSGQIGDSTADADAKIIENAGLSSQLSRPKPNADEIVNAAKENNWPLLQGMTSGSKEVQMAEDALLNGPPTLASIARRKLYNDAYDAASTSVNQALDAESPISETEVGNAVKSSLSQKLEAENEPIKALYNSIGDFTQNIAVSDKSTGALSRTIRNIVSDENLIKGTPEYNFVETMADGIDQVKNLDALKNFRTALSRQTGKETKFVAGLISEKLNNLETNAIKRFAETAENPLQKQAILDGLKDIQDAKNQYREFKGKLQTLGKSLGKSKVYGPQDFIDFIDGINPQQLTRRIFNENNTEFANFFAKNFPEEMQSVAKYQRSIIKQTATKEGLFSPTKAIKESLGIEPEMQKLVFNPEQLETMNSAKTYLDSFPKNFNPSGTAHESAFRSFFEHPTGAAISNLRDYAIQGFIKAFGHAAPGAEGKAQSLLPSLGKAVADKAPNAAGFKAAVETSINAIKGNEIINKAAKAIFSPGLDILPSKLLPDDSKREKLKKKLDDIQSNNSDLMNVGGQTGYYLEQHGAALSAIAQRASQYLSSLKPNTDKLGPLNSDRVPSIVEKDNYDRALDVAEQPLITMQSIKDGTLTPQDVVTFKSIYPSLYASVSQKLNDEMIKHVSKDGEVPYSTSLGLSLFLGQPLDASMTQQSIASNQPMPQAAPQNPGKAAPAKGKHSMAALNKISPMMQTSTQARSADRLAQA